MKKGKEIESLSRREIINVSFVTADGVTFTVVEGNHYPIKSVAVQHQSYCSTLRDGVLVSLSMHGNPVPVIRVSDGVMRLCKIKIGDNEVGSTASEVSRALRILQPRHPMMLSMT